MSDRQDGLRRLVRLQEQVARIAEIERTTAETEDNEIAAAQRDLAAFVGEAPMSGKLSSLVAAQRRRLSARKALAEQRVEERTTAFREAKSRLKIAERMTADVAAEDRRHEERKSLEELLDGMAGRADRSP